MIKAEYLGYKCERLQKGKVYRITTRCEGYYLVVMCKGATIHYRNLEQFLKEWKVRAVYSGGR